MRKQSTLSRFTLICSLCIAMMTARAQYVAIPDSNFGNWLYNNGYSSCLTGNGTTGYQLDTNCSAVRSDTLINCNYSNIYSLTGIQYFTSLRRLICSDNHLSTLSALPASITWLDCSTNSSLTSISSLPPSLGYMDCSGDHLTTLPTLPSTLTSLQCSFNDSIIALPALPSGLTFLECDNNLIPSLPALPSTLTTLDFSYNLVSSLPSLPVGLQIMDCSSNRLTSLPVLPSTLTSLNCGFDSLSSLPSLPAGLTYLECTKNSISVLPTLPPSLNSLLCNNNLLRSLPALPAGLTTLECSYNPLYAISSLPLALQWLSCSGDSLSSLPTLPPTLTTLECNNNPNLYCLPRIYQDTLVDFYIAGTQITCIPNAFSANYCDIHPSTLPLCDPASGCDFYYNVAGTVHYDTAATCASDSLHPGQFIHNMKIQLLQSGNVVQQFYTFSSGGYSFKTPSLSTYTVDIDTTALPIAVVCPASDSRTVSLSATDTVEKYQSFGMQCSGVDFGVSYIEGSHFRPTYTSQINISAGNLAQMNYNANCGAGVSGTVTTTLSGSVTYISPAPGALTPTSVSGNVLTYNLSNLDNLQPSSLGIIVMTDTNAVVGTGVCITATITPSVPDVNPYNDTLTQCFLVVHSWDPNEKDVYPLDTFQSGQWLTYTVGFQNTGTDTAYLVVVRDTLSANVDASSFKFLAASSKVVIQLFGSAMVFTFPHINLVDSAANPPLSTGWIEYKVRSLSGLSAGTQVLNTASVYFDNNSALETNTTVNTVGVSSPLVCTDTTVYTAHANCLGDSFLFAGHYLKLAGLYYDTLTRAGGCDSIISLDLGISPPPSVSLSWDSLVSANVLYAHHTQFSDTAWVQLCSPTIFTMDGGYPQGGTYTGEFIHGDTADFTNFNSSYWGTIDTVTYTYIDSNGCANSVTDTLLLSQPCEGINNISAVNSVSLYPNPNHGSFTLSSSSSIGSEYTITDMLGNVIEEKTITTNEQSIELKEASEGVYTLVVLGSQPVRFVILR